MKAACLFMRMDAHLAAVPADVLALSQAEQTMFLWSELAFSDASPLGLVGDQVCFGRRSRR